jgi:hypothetical protein
MGQHWLRLAVQTWQMYSLGSAHYIYRPTNAILDALLPNPKAAPNRHRDTHRVAKLVQFPIPSGSDTMFVFPKYLRMRGLLTRQAHCFDSACVNTARGNRERHTIQRLQPESPSTLVETATPCCLHPCAEEHQAGLRAARSSHHLCKQTLPITFLHDAKKGERTAFVSLSASRQLQATTLAACGLQSCGNKGADSAAMQFTQTGATREEAASSHPFLTLKSTLVVGAHSSVNIWRLLKEPGKPIKPVSRKSLLNQQASRAAARNRENEEGHAVTRTDISTSPMSRTSPGAI